MFQVSYAAALSGGVLAFLSPCILPLVLAYLWFHQRFLAGTNNGG